MATLGFFLKFAGGDQEDSDVNVGILGLLLAFFSLFLLCILFSLSLFYGFLLFCLSWSFRSLPPVFLCSTRSPCTLPFVAFIAREDNAVSSDHKV